MGEASALLQAVNMLMDNLEVGEPVEEDSGSKKYMRNA